MCMTHVVMFVYKHAFFYYLLFIVKGVAIPTIEFLSVFGYLCLIYLGSQ